MNKRRRYKAKRRRRHQRLLYNLFDGYAYSVSGKHWIAPVLPARCLLGLFNPSAESVAAYDRTIAKGAP